MAVPMPPRSTLVGVDTNFLLDLAVPKDKAHDAVEIIRRRVPGVEFLVPPTVVDELSYIVSMATPRLIARWQRQRCAKLWRGGGFDLSISYRWGMGLSMPSLGSSASSG